ncbi:unnamed protein product [Closterium sp. NIES-65]|nr:unnamed protein product [Closterium sp. NIES-65]
MLVVQRVGGEEVEGEQPAYVHWSDASTQRHGEKGCRRWRRGDCKWGSEMKRWWEKGLQMGLEEERVAGVWRKLEGLGLRNEEHLQWRLEEGLRRERVGFEEAIAEDEMFGIVMKTVKWEEFP